MYHLTQARSGQLLVTKTELVCDKRIMRSLDTTATDCVATNMNEQRIQYRLYIPIYNNIFKFIYR